MEKIYEPKYDKLINIGNKLSQFKRNLPFPSLERMPTTYEEVKDLLNITDESVEHSISVSQLSQSDDIRITELDLADKHRYKRSEITEIPAQALKLRCVRLRVENQKGSNRTKPMKYNKNKHLRLEHKICGSERDIVPYEEMLIVVRVYEPFVYHRGCSNPREPKLSQEFAVLGSQKLTELKDKIYCQCKLGPLVDISDDISKVKDVDFLNSCAHDPANDPGFFFITDTFYNDVRHRDVDYSKEIREWMQTHSSIGEVQVKSMEETRFNDINVRVGYPQVYKHSCLCEHIISFSDIRLIAPDDSLTRSTYPMLRVVPNSPTKLCLICGYEEASFIVKDSSAHIHDPAFLCKDCVVSYHYVDGNKKGSFKLYRYFGNLPLNMAAMNKSK